MVGSLGGRRGGGVERGRGSGFFDSIYKMSLKRSIVIIIMIIIFFFFFFFILFPPLFIYSSSSAS